MPEPTSDILRANLDAIRRHSPVVADLLDAATPAPLTWDTARTGQAIATLPPPEQGGRPTPLCSKYDPAAEADKLLGEVDPRKTACVVLLGLGLGYHAEAAHAMLGPESLVLLYEPDPALLRAVLERRDLAKLLARPNVQLFAGADVDRATLLSRTETFAQLFTQGTQLVTLPLARKLHPEPIKQFGQAITDIVAYSRTNIATALVNASRTCRNLANNLDVYAAGATTNELHDAAKGYPAVCVGAGPSLVKNVHLLQDPEVRKNVVVIAVQTALKPLLDRGIQPDFVTALDYSPICARFYEGLPELPHVTLVAEPKANPAILDAFPGPVRICRDAFNDQLLGDPKTGGLGRVITPIRGGATVAHLSFYLAQHLGCDPILFIGQDLGFSDGLYYAPGTAVHQVWDCELNPFNTLEMMEWQRIVRMRGHLRRFDDIHGRPIFSDEQMLTYLKQFERDFADAEANEQLVIDATEGGMPKSHTTRLTFADALEQHATRPVPTLPIPSRALDRDRLGKLDALLKNRIDQTLDLKRMSRDSLEIIGKMSRCLENGNKKKLDQLFAKLERNRKRVEGDLKEPFALVSQLNTIGSFRRNRTDRSIAQDLNDPKKKLAAQLTRDRENIEWIVQACDEALTIFREAHERARERIARDTSAATINVTANPLSQTPRKTAAGAA